MAIYQNKILFPEILWQRPVHYYKAKAGKVFLLSGSKGMFPYSIILSEAVFRSGTGVLTLGMPEMIKHDYKNILPEAMTLLLPSTPSGSLSKKGESEILEQVKASDAVIIGPGLSENAETTQLIWELLFVIDKPIILAGDGVTALIKGIEVIRREEDHLFFDKYLHQKKGPLAVILTTAETEKLLKAAKFDEFKNIKFDDSYLTKNKESVAELLAKKLDSLIILKDADVVISKEDEESIITRIYTDVTCGNDILPGIVGSFIAQNPDKIYEAIATAVYLYRYSGDIAKSNIGVRSVKSSDIIRYLPDAIKKSEEN